ncbi:hypothetical protein GCM10023185_26170 [Hymenobacter saemangeumensis]|uniref:T9SS type A sorting domain-containing protein n=1 Tax=Hymenobacter saemangeumensis TaxID=1084522 RepID=A0ABP8IID3_9BACT
MAASAQTTLYTFNGGGTTGIWNDPTTWTTDPSGSTQVNPAVPISAQQVVILNGYTVQLAQNQSNNNMRITIQAGGVLDLRTFTFTNAVAINTLSGQGTLRMSTAAFPIVTNNDFDDPGTGTVEYYDLPTNTSLPGTVSQYNNLRVVNTTATARTATLGSTLTVQGNLTLQRTGTGALTFNLTGTSPLTLVGNLNVGAGTTMGLSGGGFQNVTSSGNVTIDQGGTLDFLNGGPADITFVGTADRALTNNGTTRLNRIIVNKGTGQQFVQSITSGPGATLTVNTAASGGVVNLQNGTLRLGSNISLPTLINGTTGNSGYTIPASAGLWIDGADVTLPSNVNGGLISLGMFRITAGTFTSTNNDGGVIGDVGSYLIEGGTVSLEKFSPVKVGTPLGSFTMTGGTLNVQGTGTNMNNQKAFARFSVPYPTQTFSMSGGTINIYNTEYSGSGSNAGLEIAVQPGNFSVTGGDVNIVLPDNSDSKFNMAFFLTSTAPFWNLTVTKPGPGVSVLSLSATGTVTTSYPLVVLRNLTLSGPNTPTLLANGRDVTVQNHFTVGSTARYTPGANTTRFQGTQNHIFTVDGTVGDGTVAGAGLWNMVVNKPAGSLSLAGTAATFPQVRNELRIESGVLDDGNKQLNVLGNVTNSATHTSSGGTGSITLAGTALQTIAGDGNGVFGNLSLDNPTLAAGQVAVQLLSAQAVSGTLLFLRSHIFDIGTHRLSITSTSRSAVATQGGAFSNQRMIRTAGNQSDGGLRKTYGAFSVTNAEAFLFPVGTLVGTTSVYTPASIGITDQPSRYGKITVAPVRVANPFLTNATLGLQYYWKVSSADFLGLPANKITHRFSAPKNGTGVNLVNGNLNNYVPGYYAPTQWTIVGGVSDVDKSPTSSFDITFANVNIDGEYTAGEAAAFGPITAFYSRVASGNWESPSSWSTSATLKHAGPASAAVPGPSNPVYIGDGNTFNHIITVTANNARSGSLEVANGSTLDVGTLTGHNFGSLPNATVQGAGRMRISSNLATAQFPGGDFGNFLGPQGGTVEYYTNASVSFALPTGQVNYRNLVLNAAAGRTITLPAIGALRIYEDLSGGTLAGFTGFSDLTTTSLTIDGSLRQQRGTLRFNGGTRSVSVGRNVEISAGATVGVSVAGIYTLQIGGSVTNNGTFNMSGVAVTFLGTGNESITGTTAGASTTFTNLTVDKGTTQAPVLTMDVTGTLSVPTNNWLTLLGGTFRFAKPNTTITLSSGDYSVVSSAALQVDSTNTVINVTTGGTLFLAGRAFARTGTLNVGVPGSAGINSIEYSGATEPAITIGTGGVLNVTGQIRRPTTSTQGRLRYEQFGGTVTVFGNGSTGSERGQLEVLNAGSHFGMSGGTLNLRRSNNNAGVISDLYLQPATSSVTGGTIALGDATTSSGTFGLTIDTTIPLFNLRVEPGTGTTANTATLMQNPLVLRGGLTIANSQSVFDANGFDVSVAGNFVNNNATANASGLLNVGGYRVQSSTQTTTLNGSSNDQQVSGATGALTAFANLVVNNTRPSGVVQLQPNTDLVVNNLLTLQAGELADNGQTITARGNVVNSARHSGAGRINLSSSVVQTIAGNGSGRFGNLQLSNTVGVTLLANQQIDGTLTFNANGSLSIGSYLLRLTNPSASAVVGSTGTRYIRTNGIVADAGVEKTFASTASSFVFPVGSVSKYTPVTMNVTNTGGAGGTITVRPINSAHPATTSAANTELRYYWQTSATGFGATPTVTHTYQYLATDVQGTESAYVVGRFQGSSWTMPTATVNTTAKTLTLSNVNFFDGDFTAGEAAEFGAVRVYYTRTAMQTGSGANWEDATSWTFNADGSTDPEPANRPTTMPSVGNPVVILAGHIIKTNSPARGAASLQLNGTLNLGDYTSNNFNTVTGTGRLIIASAVFPAGNYSAFTSSGAGTVEYAGNINYTLTARNTYNNLEFSGTGIKTLSTVNLGVLGQVLVSSGTVRNPSNVTLTLSNASQNFINQGTFELGNGSLQVAGALVNAGDLTLGTGTLNTGTTLVNSGLIVAGAGAVSVGTTLFNNNPGIYNAGSGSLQVQNNLNSTGTFNANQGAISVGDSLLTSGTFQAGNGNITVQRNFTNRGTYTANANLLTVNGNFANRAGSFNAGSGTVVLQGNWINSATFTPGTSTVSFVSNSSRALGGNLTTTFFTVNKLGAGSLTLAQNATVSNILNLESGNMVTGANILNLTNQAIQPIVGQSQTAYVAGRLAISFPNDVNTSRVFPVGNAQFYRPVTIRQNGTGGSSPVVLVEMINSIPSGTIAPTLSNLSRIRYYAIRTLSGTISQPTVRLSFNTNSTTDEIVNVPGNLRIARSTSGTGPWTDAGGAGVFTPAAPAGNAVSGITTIGTNTFFALASTNEVDNPLPVELTRFTATPQAQAVQLSWTTASEKNSAYFEVQRSADGRTFEAIGRVQAQGNTTAPQAYALLDKKPLAGTSYYRLRAVDTDAAFAYSQVVTVRFTGVEAAPAVLAYPNPNAGAEFRLAATNLPAGLATVRVVDVLGHVISQQVVDFGPAADVAVPQAKRLAKGLYVVLVQTSAGTFTQKLVVE